MTRWARANNVHRHKPAEATPWSQLRGGAAGAGGGGGAAGGGAAAGGAAAAGGGAAGAAAGGGGQADPLRKTQPARKTNRKKKEYVSEDVNGFLEFLQQSGGRLLMGEEGGGAGVREEVDEALRKDQRREDRRIRRQKEKKNKMLCFSCRRPGHGLADCPEVDVDEEFGRGICYRCGSTEHEVHACRAKVDPALGDLPFAKCFICGQTGHLSRSCPQNPRGLYAGGGCCRVCGSVEHFQKDCPDHQATASSLTVGWLSNNMSADHEDVHVPDRKTRPKPSKVVTF